MIVAALLLAAVLDSFDKISQWTSAPSDAVSLALAEDAGALRLDFDFHGGAGWAVARRPLPLDLPDNYELSFRLRAEAPVNNLEIKLIDPSGQNVWWVNRKGFVFPKEWRTVRLKKRHFEFAWGPAGGGVMKQVGSLEIAITAGTGGRGTVWLDDLALTPLSPDHPYDRTPAATASSAAPDHGPERVLGEGAWRSAPGGGVQWLALDFLESREYGGLVIDWEPGAAATRYDVQTSDDGARWSTVRSVQGGNGGRDDLYLPETESRHLRLLLHEGVEGAGAYGITDLAVKPLAFSASLNDFFQSVARDAPRGLYPRSLVGEQSYWTIVSAADAPAGAPKGLLGEDGALEVGAAMLSIEPFLYVDGKLIGWSDVQAAQTLADGYLPIPIVTWKHPGLTLEITASADPAGRVLQATYRLRNTGRESVKPRLFLALRPFQVNPPWQFLGTAGGAAEVRSLAWDGQAITVDPERTIHPIPIPTAFGAAAFDQGDVTDWLRQGKLPPASSVTDPFGHASGALAWDLDLAPGTTKEVSLAIPQDPAIGTTGEGARAWHDQLDRVGIRVPPEAEPYVRVLKTQLAWILAQKDGPALRPGSRSYARSWVRDGALMSEALLRLGHPEAVRAYVDWFAPFQFADGKVPCCVDARGADPVPEHDSAGELIYTIAEYHRYTHDRAFLSRMLPRVKKAVAYLEALRQQRRTPEYQTPGKSIFYGLLPESISHEGYSSHPVHSYWDDFWALRGLKDAVGIATALGRDDLKDRWIGMRDEFATDLHASIRGVIAERHLDVIPASADLGDLDPTSTSIALAPAGEQSRLPRPELLRTFERYDAEVTKRSAPGATWDAYTPYELRNVSTYVRLGWREKTLERLAGFLGDLRPAGWNQWAEVVWREPRIPKFVGDMPHAWVSAEYIRSFLDLFAYEEEGTLVLAAGLPAAWLKKGIALERLPTPWGPLSYTLKEEDGDVRYRIEGPVMPPGGIILRLPAGEEIVLRALPAEGVARRRG